MSIFLCNITDNGSFGYQRDLKHHEALSEPVSRLDGPDLPTPQ
jgi:hypothetical protein